MDNASFFFFFLVKYGKCFFFYGILLYLMMMDLGPYELASAFALGQKKKRSRSHSFADSFWQCYIKRDLKG